MQVPFIGAKREDGVNPSRTRRCNRGRKPLNAHCILKDKGMWEGTAGIKTAYNAQTAVDEHRQVIIAAEVTNQSYDVDHLVPMVDQVEENTASASVALSFSLSS